ncbi:MAG: hypothetical protein GQ570_01025 [Helicobacteraceae bacterium]|nr:hypothetical protein [Helicobacteraceae bacterium]
MTIIHKPTFSQQLKQIIEYIAQDKPSASMNFKNKLKENINLITNNPYQYEQSQYFNNKNIRNMTFKKYTIVYRVRPIKQEIEILRIFKKNKLNELSKNKSYIEQKFEVDKIGLFGSYAKDSDIEFKHKYNNQIIISNIQNDVIYG